MKDLKPGRKTVLVTGANGFVGRYLTSVLKDTYDVLGTRRSDTDEHNKILGVTYATMDLTDKSSVDKIVQEYRPDFIIHLAAETTGWFENPYAVFEVNVIGTLNLYEAVLRLKRQDDYSPKVIYVSSSETYGSAATVDPITEETRLSPVNHYGASKASGDIVSYDYVRSHSLNIVTVRPFTHTGPGQKLGFFVPDIASQIAHAEKKLGDGKLRVGNLDAVRDYLDVRDVVQAYKLLLDAPTRPGDVYNICSGVGVAISDLLNMIVSLSVVPLVIESDPQRMRPSDVPIFVGDNTKLKRAIDWKPIHRLEETVQDTLNYWRSVV